ncbi:Tuberculostearic acid methyltransferase UfaA1 [Hypsizygus marmoreus]|uniref:Tuberculostearic acid methyltransferase UfaA1 n=1 Tax=Hypsizygus marmoreus TaxID=39966 RepID=A0A369K2Z6_HYPMA|nr:Tuberculostearic acid methyltransferase UfaA1 [Hypsizygus marmoreus]
MSFFDADKVVLPYIAGYVKGYLLKALEHGIRNGSLHLTIHNGEEYVFGQHATKQSGADIHVKNDNFWLRIFYGYDLGFAEAYMHGDFETTSLKNILNLWLDNRSHLVDLGSPLSRLSSAISALTLRLTGQSLSNAKLNVVAAYDYDNDLFKAFLSEDMMYSCALWPDELGGVRGDLTKGPFPGDLEAAQLYKVHHVLKKARVRRGDRLLEFGSGWGTMAIEAAKLGCTVDTLTLSIQQKSEAEERIRKAGLKSRITVHLLDYRNLPPSFEKAFDAFVAVEMVEHVGLKYHEQFFQILNWALKSDRAAVVITATTQPEWRYSTLQAIDYARKYQWPNAFCPAPTPFCASAMTAAPGAFALESIEDHGHHYPRTLREWGRRFQTNWNSISSELIKNHPELTEGDNLGILKRKWEYMYVYAEIGFAKAYTSCHCFTFVRPENVVTSCH